MRYTDEEAAMRRGFTQFVALSIMLASSAALADWESSILPSTFQMESSREKALATAKQSGKHVIVYYTRTNCPPCNVIQYYLRTNEDVARPFRESYVFTAVWGTAMGRAERDEYRTKYDVSSAPSWLVFTNAGEYVCTARGGFDGVAGAAQLHAALKEKLAAPPTDATLAARACL
jgi:thioredoxin-related protein